ncbi:hypothetical protein GCM10028789_21790 [Sinomonas halotolerans]
MSPETLAEVEPGGVDRLVDAPAGLPDILEPQLADVDAERPRLFRCEAPLQEELPIRSI